MCSELISVKVIAPTFYASFLYRMVNSQDRNLYAQDKTFLAMKHFKVNYIGTSFCKSGLAKQKFIFWFALP